MKRIVIILSVLLCGALSLVEVNAQWLPERKMVRGANKEYASENYSQAEIGYRKAMEKMKEPAGDVYNTAMFNLSDAVYKQERYEEAESNFMNLAQDSTWSANASANYYNAGNAMVKQRRLEEALEAYKNAMRRDPSDMEAKFNYAYVKKLLEKDEENQNDDNQDDNNDQQDKNQDNQGGGDNPENNNDNNDQDDESSDQDPDDKKDQPESNGGGQQPSGLSKEDAEKMLEMEQMNEDKTRENMQEKGAAAVGRSGKNW